MSTLIFWVLFASITWNAAQSEASDYLEIPGACMNESNYEIKLRTTLERCREMCDNDDDCQSFEYKASKGRCQLSHEGLGSPNLRDPCHVGGYNLYVKVCPADLVFVVDRSGSILVDDWADIKEFIKHTVTVLLQEIDLGVVKVGIVAFSTNASIEIHLGELSDYYEIMDAIDDIPDPDGWTNTELGLRYMIWEFGFHGRADAPDIAVVITDGYATDPMYLPTSTNDPVAVANEAKDDYDIHIMSIGIGGPNVAQVEALSSDPQVEGENYFLPTTIVELLAISDDIAERICEL